MNPDANVSARVNFDYGQRQKAALKEMPSRLEPMVPAPRREDFKTQGQASPVL